MARAPFQVLIIPFIKYDNEIKYCVFERKSPLCQHQFIAGGGEDNEVPLEAAKRECFEEAQIQSNNFIELISLCYIPTKIFSESQRKAWNNIFVIPEYAFAIELAFEEIIISDEHINFKWCTYDEAISLLKWDSNKTALYELDCKIKSVND
ncbi:MAG: dihydroneopterin triphosphate pyrophosphatase [Firmicutes bacterium ADurb.Bin300]|jgi:dATP pyrophosphohydrolase|nr:MAG: dihydroneopterin triphosphate pyrophosphatase [Firmicutes bacterium ADurb.Bin300]HOD01813.1 NUDIX pyrophosphatase [Clostridiales bacterium]